MAKELTPRQKEARQKARQLAKTAGKAWANLPKEERRTFLKKARASAGTAGASAKVRRGVGAEKQPATNPTRDQAQKTAKDAGHVWRDLPKEQRQKYMAQARDERNRQLAQARREKLQGK